MPPTEEPPAGRVGSRNDDRPFVAIALASRSIDVGHGRKHAGRAF